MTDAGNTSGRTAMDVVRSAERGEVSRDQLVIILESWSFQPKHRTRGLADDWETRPDSFEAVEYAYLVGLIDDTAYELISRLAGHTSNSRDQDR